jgi:hypothetical protein
MVLSILVWYLHPPEVVPQQSLLPQIEGIPMQIPVLTPTTPPSPPLISATTTTGARRKKKDPTTPLNPEFNFLVYYVIKKATPPIDLPLFLSYAI